jgi:hypothetical protein
MPRYLRSSLSEITPPHYATASSARHTAAIAAPHAKAAIQAQAPNPLWAINIGMGVFFALAAVVVMLD